MTMRWRLDRRASRNLVRAERGPGDGASGSALRALPKDLWLMARSVKHEAFASASEIVRLNLLRGSCDRDGRARRACSAIRFHRPAPRRSPMGEFAGALEISVKSNACNFR